MDYHPIHQFFLGSFSCSQSDAFITIGVGLNGKRLFAERDVLLTRWPHSHPFRLNTDTESTLVTAAFSDTISTLLAITSVGKYDVKRKLAAEPEENQEAFKLFDIIK